MYTFEDDAADDNEPPLCSLSTLHGCLPRLSSLVVMAVCVACVVCVFNLASLPNVLLCDAAVAGVVVLSVVAVGGSFMGSLYLLPSLLRSRWPWVAAAAGGDGAKARGGSLNDDAYYQELEAAVASAVTASLLAAAPAAVTGGTCDAAATPVLPPAVAKTVGLFRPPGHKGPLDTLP